MATSRAKPAWTAKADDKADKKAGIREGSKRDNKLDVKRGVPVKRAPARKK
jgi:hypothetical protein